MVDSTYPQHPAEWRSAIQDGIGLSEVAGSSAYEAGEFPFDKLEEWIRARFGEGFTPDFVPALLRNIRGLVAWVFGGGDEPRWPGSDDENPGLS